MSDDEHLTDEKNENSMRQHIKERIGKRLAYLLRYGAHKEGLHVHDGGFVKLNEILNTPLLKHNLYFMQRNEETSQLNDSEIIMEEINTSTSHRNINRFELKNINNEMFVRATYGRKFTRSPYHQGSKVNRLMEISLDYIVQHINNYDFEGFPDEYLIK